ncbi:mucin-5AC [Frankliniella occidentalis]|uniref:Mucin-5AC n=1 Tax=Frankliniella occidentalis TaxID=133901 RepID=A0A6J1S216_FRAOC|nr:mucin-5AC [Frankliniella occidentalis]XP_052125497.1 mucin-5AC [Frankliniella occidentalis]
MTLHWWQHWFWITGRAPVVGALLCLLLTACDVRGQLPPSLEIAGPTALAMAVPVPVAPWLVAGGASRRLLGFAGQTQVEDGAVPVSPGPPEPSPSPDPEVSSATITYLTTLDPGQGPAEAPRTRAREPKAIGVPPAVLRAVPSTSTAPRPRPATSILEIVEELSADAGTASPSPESPPVSPHAPSPSSTTTADTGAEDEAAGFVDVASSAEMPNDEPARAFAATSTTTESPELDSASSSPAPSPTAGQPVQVMSLTTAPAGPSVASVPLDSSWPATPAAPSFAPSTTSTTTSSPSYITSTITTSTGAPGSQSDPVVVHPGVSVPRRSTAAPAEAATSTEYFSTVEPPSVLRSAPSTLSVSRQQRPGSGAGPGAMSLSAGGGLDAGSITGIVLGIVVFAGLVGTVSFVLYRRRYINKPQTLNDKCSNPDSSGYIDDSTLRENSEEMYSLDNDSFLNSLEAMTIQNYWTDTVKHTKL